MEDYVVTQKEPVVIRQELLDQQQKIESLPSDGNSEIDFVKVTTENFNEIALDCLDGDCPEAAMVFAEAGKNIIDLYEAEIHGVQEGIAGTIEALSHPIDNTVNLANFVSKVLYKGATGQLGEAVTNKLHALVENFSKLTPVQQVEEAYKFITETTLQAYGTGKIIGLARNTQGFAKFSNLVKQGSAAVANSKVGKAFINGCKKASEIVNSKLPKGEIGWSMPEGGGMINGRWYTQHALERMAPDNLQVRAILEQRALRLGLRPGDPKYLDYIKPRGIPPSVIEDTIRTGQRTIGKSPGTLHFENENVMVIINEKTGAVVTVYPK